MNFDYLEDEQFIKVKNTILNVDRIVKRIARVQADTKEDAILTITKRWNQQMNNYRDYVNLLVDSMRRELNNVKFRGVDAQYCYDTNFWAINEHGDIAYQSAIKCQESAEISIENSLQFLDSLKSLGYELIKELNDIFLNCYDDDTTKTQSCFLSEFGKINNAVKEFEEDAKYIEYNSLPASNYVVLQTTQCLSNAYLLARFESQGAMMSNSRCIRNAVNKKTDE
ncbi:hypothetical protein ALC60_08520 [Trachymyrmex zeteki]|uniref:Uncharacterized protein n=2 Tax=Mycetomoellerius zeteki TaxID=64791 RepID=A0A151WX68_9HYME|nr:hypothetical protein ALC60_08520 [Trachymyrmex zeteki]